MAIIILGRFGNLAIRNFTTASEAGRDVEYTKVNPRRVNDKISFTSVCVCGGGGGGGE